MVKIPSHAEIVGGCWGFGGGGLVACCILVLTD